MARICKDAQPLRAVRPVRTAFFLPRAAEVPQAAALGADARHPCQVAPTPWRRAAVCNRPGIGCRHEHLAGKPWTVPLERWIFPVSTINLATASDNPDRARVARVKLGLGAGPRSEEQQAVAVDVIDSPTTPVTNLEAAVHARSISASALQAGAMGVDRVAGALLGDRTCRDRRDYSWVDR